MRAGDSGLATVFGRFLRLALLALLFLLAAGIVLEAALRALGAQPQNLYRVGFSATVIDRWTGWAMRPNVRLNEYAVTNAYGLHEDREVTLAKPPGVTRVAVVGSSVTWGLGEALENTIPRSAERDLRKSGCDAQVLNFGGQGFNILNAAAYVETKVHQFSPDAIVVIMDLQMSFPHFPLPNPITDEQAAIVHLGFFEGLFKRATEYSVVLTALDDVAAGRQFFKRHLPFPVELPAPRGGGGSAAANDEYGRRQLERLLSSAARVAAGLLDALKAKDAVDGVAVRPAPRVHAAPPPSTIEQYEASRRRELGGVIAGMAAFARQMGIPLYFTTPYGPYFHASSEEIGKFSLNMLTDAARLYGGLQPALQREARLSSSIIREHAAAEGARVIDMFPATLEATMASGDFSGDGIHFSRQGYRRVGAIIADRLLKDGLCAPAPHTAARN